ncbi:ATP-binding protein [Streptococcus oricebi]|uniref:ATP-binding protein n=2 Tax=Streptococcus oricebi TaxID=1547447 RepID=A0ABS5B5K1_9STRE|nr:ATP-binding protein [Streptococcus oricebi]
MFLLFLAFILIAGLQALSITLIYSRAVKAKIDFRFALYCFLFFSLNNIIAIVDDWFYAILSFSQPLFIYLYFRFFRVYKEYLNIFIAIFICLAVKTSETFFLVMISSIVSDKIFLQNLLIFFPILSLLTTLNMLLILRSFSFDFSYIKDQLAKNRVIFLSLLLLAIHVTLKISDFTNSVENFNSFSSMLATICFLIFLSTLLYLQLSHRKQEKDRELKEKEKEHLQLQKYADEIFFLYSEVRGFRHDYGGILTSMRSSINKGDIDEVKRIYEEVLENINIQLSSNRYSYFDLNNIGDSAWRSLMTEMLFRAHDKELQLIFEIKDYIDRLPIELLDLIRITSILLNNAIEGAYESLKKTVHISLIKLEKEVVFVVRNSRKKMDLDLEKVYQVGFSTKGEKRGIGLINMKEIIAHYDDIILDTTIEPEYFTQVVTFRRGDCL